jgi:hypothetical protein
MKQLKTICIIVIFTGSLVAQVKQTAPTVLNAEFSKAAIKLLTLTRTNTQHHDLVDAAVAEVEAAARTRTENDEFICLRTFAYAHLMFGDTPADTACMNSWLVELKKRSSKIPDVCNAKDLRPSKE